MSFEEADHLEDLEGAMAAAGGDLVRGVGGGLLYMRLRRYWCVGREIWRQHCDVQEKRAAAARSRGDRGTRDLSQGLDGSISAGEKGCDQSEMRPLTRVVQRVFSRGVVIRSVSCPSHPFGPTTRSSVPVPIIVPRVCGYTPIS